jgi:hypothetical protein
VRVFDAALSFAKAALVDGGERRRRVTAGERLWANVDRGST